MSTPQQHLAEQPTRATILMPAPTAWPFVLAVGVALIFAGLLTGAAVSVLGRDCTWREAWAGSANCFPRAP